MFSHSHPLTFGLWCGESGLTTDVSPGVNIAAKKKSFRIGDSVLTVALTYGGKLMDEKKKDGIYFIPVAIKSGMLIKLSDPVSCEEVTMALSKSVVDAFVSFFVAGPKEAKPEGAKDGPNQ